MTSTVPHQALYRRWRAQTFSEIVGQEAVVETLRNAVRSQRVSHAVLFVGPRGTGKTSLARILAKAVNCTDLQDGDACDRCPSCISIRDGTSLDLVEIDAASNRGIDDVRGLRERLAYPPGQLKRKVYILDEAHQITGPAWNALLKSIEEPPDFVMFMFASTEPSAFPPAILSRLQRYDVRRLTVTEIEGKLARILAADGREADPAAIHLIARLAAGGMRDAESMLDQLLSAAPDRIDEAHVRDLLGLADAEVVETFVDDLVRGDGAAGVALLDSLEERGRDLRALLDQAVEAIRAELIAGFSDPAAVRHDPAALVAAARRLAAIDPNRSGIGGLRLGLELAMFAAEPAAGPVGPVVAARVEPRERPGTQASSPPRPTEVSGPAVAPASTGSRQASPAPPAAQASATVAPARTGAPARAEPVIAPAAPPTPTPPTSAEPIPASKTGDADLDALLSAWPAIVDRLSQHPPTKPLILKCRPVAVDGAIVTLGFPEEQAFLKEQAERRRPGIEAGIAEVVGHPVTVRCVVANVELAEPSDDLVAEARRIFAEELADVGEIS
ncbi:MAG TPA: DNA polymerase III subunit gamma/tau [Candidatus Limnocylindrales bacterium]|nr:DNA polymerase III subunit gamma/tau [Candidatus Limnocylindrales bacterium]